MTSLSRIVQVIFFLRSFLSSLALQNLRTAGLLKKIGGSGNLGPLGQKTSRISTRSPPDLATVQLKCRLSWAPVAALW